jgi:hypothetical protein
LNSITEIRITDSEVYTNSNGRAAIFYWAGDREKVTYYVRGEALHLLQDGAEETYNPRDLISSMIREIVVFPQILKRIAREVREVDERAQLIERLNKQVAQA